MQLGLVIRPNSRQQEWRELEHFGSIWLGKATFGFWAMSDRLVRQNEWSTLGLVSAFKKCNVFDLHGLVGPGDQPAWKRRSPGHNPSTVAKMVKQDRYHMISATLFQDLATVSSSILHQSGGMEGLRLSCVFKDGRYGDGMDLSRRRAALMMMKLTVCAYRSMAIYKRNLVCTFLSTNTRATEHRNGGDS
ncbi:hypothetical protein NC651_032249 [Populus alba x Populus x berolinensis]|nr:hypothetical protein NC651_032249 [Populus alba x Populus x berolinensis]